MAESKTKKPKGPHGGYRANSGPDPTPINITRALALRKQGVSYVEIARRLDSTASIVTLAIKRAQASEVSERRPVNFPWTRENP